MAVVKRRRGNTGPAEPTCPPLAVYLWGAWNALHAGRSSGMVPNPISWTDFKAYQDVTGDRLLLWEVAAIRAVDNAYIKAMSTPTGG